MTSSELVKTIVSTLDAKKAENIEILKIQDLTVLTDYFIIASGTSTTQVKALAEEVEFVLSQKGVEPHHVEGRASSWILLDYNFVVVHVFYGDTREFYGLERLWKDAEKIPAQEFLPPDAQNE